MTDFITIREINTLPRLPLNGSLDLTWRCNNNCRHCWVNIPQDDASQTTELSFAEIRSIMNESKQLGCRNWSLSGGEPMLRADFQEIFKFVIHNSSSYTLNTNATLITPAIAQLMRKPGSKLISIYGADAEIHDHITRRQGSFDEMMQGIAYLKEAGAKFTIQIVPMKDNLHQYNDMMKLAESLSHIWRLGASWLNLAGNDVKRNKEIIRQRLKADDILEIEPPDLVSYSQQKRNQESDNSYYKCIKTRNSFYINPYGKMSFCPYVRDNQFCFDLRQGSFSEGWDEFIPSLIEMLKPGTEYRDGCGSCEYFTDCNWCPVYAYLEHGNHESKIKYLCAITNEKMELRKKRKHEHQRLFQIGGMTILVDSDLPIKDTTFDAKFKLFQIDETDTNLITIRHRFEQPSDLDLNSDEVLYDRIPWRIYRRRNNFIYTLNSTPDNKGKPKLIAETNLDHTYTTIYHNDENKRLFQKGNIPSLSTFTSDQIILSRVLADRNGCYIHAAGVILDGQGLLFPGVKEAGKTTISNLLKEHAEVLCDDRIIMRNVSELPYIYGTWSHGDLTDVSPSSTPLRAILFLKKSNDNRLVKINDNGEVLKNILPLIIRPLISDEWWQKVLQVIEEVIITVPAYYLYFDQSSGVVELLRESFGKEA